MRKIVFAAAALLLLGSAQGTEARPVLQPMKAVTVPYYPGLKDARTLRASFAPEAATVTPSQIGECANLAALRALGARAAGADTANQNRLAELSFVLCLTGAPNAG